MNNYEENNNYHNNDKDSMKFQDYIKLQSNENNNFLACNEYIND